MVGLVREYVIYILLEYDCMGMLHKLVETIGITLEVLGVQDTPVQP